LEARAGTFPPDLWFTEEGVSRGYIQSWQGDVEPQGVELEVDPDIPREAMAELSDGGEEIELAESHNVVGVDDPAPADPAERQIDSPNVPKPEVFGIHSPSLPPPEMGEVEERSDVKGTLAASRAGRMSGSAGCDLGGEARIRGINPLLPNKDHSGQFRH
jgi:hypothetical protein